MNVSADTLILLKKYVKGELNDEERRSFEDLLSDHPEFREEVELTRRLIRATERAERERLLSLIQKIDIQSHQQGAFQTLKARIRDTFSRITQVFSPTAGNLKWGLATALVLLLLAAGVWWFNRPADPLGNFEQIAYIRPEISISRRDGASLDILSNAENQYNDEHYQQSLDLLNEISSADSLYPLALLLKGHNYYRLGNYEQATAAFDTINSFKDTTPSALLPNLDNAGWTRILALLAQYNRVKEESKKRELNQALQRFLETADTTDTYYKNALKLRSLLGGGSPS